MKKLTLSMDEKVIRMARALARKNKTTVSAMFRRYVLATARIQERPLQEAVMEKSRLKKRRSIAEHPACGMWKDREDMKDVHAYLQRMREPRHVI